MTAPKISIVIPTRNRPELLRFALKSLDKTDNKRVEVIVVDNPTGRPAKDVFDEFSRPNWKYYCASTPLSMCDNWEFGLQCATGDYVSFMTDKMTFLNGAIDHICRFLDAHETDIISWRTDFYTGSNSSYGNGRFSPSWRVERPVSFDPQEALRALVSFLTPTGQEGRRYYWGKICYGAYSRDLVRRVVSRYGKMFEQLSPDFTSTIAALSLATRAIDIGSPMMMAFILPAVSNGMLTTRSTEATRRFYQSIVNSDHYRERLPEPSLYMSTHNSLLSDYRAMKAKGAYEPINDEGFESRFALRIAQDLDQIFWDDRSELDDARRELKRILERSGIDGKIDNAFLRGEKPIGFQQQIDEYVATSTKVNARKSYLYPDIITANRQAGRIYIENNEYIFDAVHSFDVKELDRCRNILGPYKTLLLDFFLRQSMQDEKTKRLALTLVEIAGDPKLEGRSVLETAPDRDNFTLIALLLHKWMQEHGVPQLMSLIWPILNNHTLSTSDLVSTTLLAVPDHKNVLDEEICSFVRQGMGLDPFQAYLTNPTGISQSDFAALYLSLSRYTHIDADGFSEFCRRYGIQSSDPDIASLLSIWTAGNSQTRKGGLVSASERWLIGAKYLFGISDWNGLNQEVARAREIDRLNPLIVEIYSTIAKFHCRNQDASSLRDFLHRNEDRLTSGYAEWVAIIEQLLGDAAKAAGQRDAAELHYDNALHLARTCFGPKDWRTMAYISNLVNLAMPGDAKKALKHQKEVHKISADTFGDQNSATKQHATLLKSIENSV